MENNHTDLKYITDKDEARRKLCECFASVSDAEVFDKLLSDLCTYTEIEQLSQRLLCAKLLLKGYTYSKIIELTDISSATLSRVSRCIQHGSGGYKAALENMTENIMENTQQNSEKEEES